MEQLLVGKEEYSRQFEDFFNSRKKAQIADLASKFPAKKSLEVEFHELEVFDTELADAIVESPDKLLAIAEEVIANIGANFPGVQKNFKPHLRISDLPSVYDVPVQSLGAGQLDKLVRVEGVVSWITDINPRMEVAMWECLHCWQTTITKTEKVEAIKPPAQCKCGRNHFKLIEEKSVFTNVQRARIQELVEKLRGNTPTAHVDLWLEDDLANQIAPGEKLIVVGILRLKPAKEGKGKSSVYNKFLDIVHVHKMQQEFEELTITKDEERQIQELASQPDIFEKITRSIAPSIYGYNELKQAVALQMFGGTPNKVLPDGQKIRNDAHILLIGDPGAGKSAILQYVARLAPKGVFVSGKGASSVGLTASAEKDELTGGWILKAGAMVLASGGMVMIDEFDKIEEEDRSALHECMESQSLSVAKAGMLTTFQTKAAVLAAANPKFGRFDPNTPPAQQFDIPPTLLSRFDLIFTIRDVLDEAQDRKIAEHIILGHTLAGKKEKPASDSAITAAIPEDLLRKYIAYARRNAFPVLTNEASDKIKEYYLELRQMGKKNNTFPVTARNIEGVIRLSEASAKIRLSQRVEMQDAERAVALTMFVLRDVFTDKETGLIDSDIVSIGQPKSRIDKLRTLLSIISTLEKEFDLVDIDKIVEQGNTVNIDEHTARKMVDELKRTGDLYEPKPGFIKSARKKGEW